MLSLVCSSPEWAESLTEMGKGKHFIGDFLPPEELEKFMETFKALKVSFPSARSAERFYGNASRVQGYVPGDGSRFTVQTLLGETGA